jgi:hypothetical protein
LATASLTTAADCPTRPLISRIDAASCSAAPATVCALASAWPAAVAALCAELPVQGVALHEFGLFALGFLCAPEQLHLVHVLFEDAHRPRHVADFVAPVGPGDGGGQIAFGQLRHRFRDAGERHADAPEDGIDRPQRHQQDHPRRDGTQQQLPPDRLLEAKFRERIFQPADRLGRGTVVVDDGDVGGDAIGRAQGRIRHLAGADRLVLVAQDLGRGEVGIGGERIQHRLDLGLVEVPQRLGQGLRLHGGHQLQPRAQRLVPFPLRQPGVEAGRQQRAEQQDRPDAREDTQLQ